MSDDSADLWGSKLRQPDAHAAQANARSAVRSDDVIASRTCSNWTMVHVASCVQRLLSLPQLALAY